MSDYNCLSYIKESMYRKNIEEIVNCFINAINPLRVYLFGSFASGTYDEESDYDFYIVIIDGENIADTTDKAYDSILHIKKRPVDIIVDTLSRFNKKAYCDNSLMIEREVYKNGILLYDRSFDKFNNLTINDKVI